MQQRVALVRAMALGAPLLLMDEPFAALDEITRADMRHLLARLSRAAGDDGAVRDPLDRRVGVHLRPRRRAVVAARADRRHRVDRPPPPPPPRARGRPRLLRRRDPPAGPPPRGRRPKVEPTRRIVAAGLVGIAVFGVVWELFVRIFDVRPFILLPPSRILGELADRPRFYLEAAAVTARHAAAGLLISLVDRRPDRRRARLVAVPRAGRPAGARRRARGPVGRLLHVDRRVARARRPAR